jgi:glyoxylase-like metal-dependent hydrolase (beta-lactamase superfamily II)
LEEEEGILFTGDHIMGQGTVVVRTGEGGSMTQHIDSLRKLLDLYLQTVLSGHGPVMNDPLAEIPGLVRHRLERDEQILGMLREGTDEDDALVSRIYGESNERLGFLARHQVVAHLKKLGGPLRQARQTLTGRLEHGTASDPAAMGSKAYASSWW